MYIAEIAPTRIRGRLVTIYQLGSTLGLFSGVLANMFIQRMGDDAWNLTEGWRLMFLAGVVPAALFGALIVPAVESPRWLMKAARREEAYATLCRINGAETAAVEARQIEQSLFRVEGRFSELFTSGFRRALLIGLMLIGLSQASGVTPLVSFLPEVFKSAGTATGDAFLQSVWVCSVKIVFTLLAFWLVDLAGRKTLILAGTCVQFLSLAAVGWLYHVHGGGTGVLLGVMSFMCAHSIGNGPVCWVIISEIFPTKVRGRAMSLATSALWVVAFFASQVFPLMLKYLGHSRTFWCFGGAAFVNLLVVLLLVPETKGRSLEQIEDIWMPRRRKGLS
jgi:SP family arabinose:H+ symporter-like MFS transporter